MISTYMIFTVLAATALAKELIECNFSEPTGVRQCFGAVGQLLIFHLPNTANPDIRLKKDEKHRILKVNKHNVTVDERYVNHPESFTNGTFKLGNAMKRHSGVYVLEEFNSDGVLVKKVNICLEIQAPVTKPVVSQMCLSPEQMNISCSSDGDEVEFKLTLNGFLLMQTSVSNVTISLDGQLMGNLMCHVWNNVSRDETVIHLTSCKDVYSFPVMTVTATASVVTVLLLVGLCLAIRNLNKPRPTTVNVDNTEVVYTEVRVKKNERRNRPNYHQNAR